MNTQDVQIQTKKSLNILYVVNDSWFFKSHRLALATAAIEYGHNAHLAAVQDHTTEYIKSKGVSFHSWKLSPRSLNPLNEILSFFSLLNTIRKIRPDLLHLVTIKSVLYGGIIARWLKIPSVVFAISGRGYIYSSQDQKQSFLKSFASKLYRYALSHENSIVIVQNENDYAFFLTNGLATEDTMVLIPGSGVDLDLFSYRVPDHNTELPVVLFASRMLKDKGVQAFVDAAKQVNQDEVIANFKLAGSIDTANPRSFSKQWLQDLPREKGIEWIGPQEQMQDLISQSAFVVLPTTYGEGVPKILIEAAACGRAIIATNWPGCTDVVIHKYNGLLVTPNDIQELAQSIGNLLDDPVSCKFYGRNGRTLAEKKFGIQKVVQTTLATYDDLQD